MARRGRRSSARRREAQDGLVRTGAGQVDQQLGLKLNHAGGDFQQPQAQGIKLRDPPKECFGIRRRSDHINQ